VSDSERHPSRAETAPVRPIQIAATLNRAARATIDSAALRANLAAARRAAPDSRVMAVIKANAYGHGIVPVARALDAADAFAVARLEEAVALREAGLTRPITLLEGVFHPEQLERAGQLGLELVVHCAEQIEMLEAAGGSARFPVWLKIDTGMHRLGFPVAQATQAAARLKDCGAVGSEFRFMTHLACADERDNEMTSRQIAEFDSAVAGLAGERSIANSAGLLAWSQSRVEWVRPGIMLFGASPFEGKTGDAMSLRPAMTLSSELIAIKTVTAGGRVGYGSTWEAREDTRIGVVAIGYGDGYPRRLGSGTPVIVGGQPARLVGRVSMDMITIDLGRAPEARLGDEVVLWGEGLPIELIAQAAETIPYELLCGVTQRVAMRVV
jgi:alanine racemase